MSIISRVSRISQKVVDETKKKLNEVRESVIVNDGDFNIPVVDYPGEDQPCYTPTVETVSTLL